ncbi:restriction endonuclease subunit S [Gilliamella sp. App6-5]|uniref:restriction endonuclease subunit S n=1 Tax=Gilliamella sp. App6-5 TaxID=3120232 RepID=UPI001C400AD8|nr:restriction endonuclease subunit S [Gilliamella apicola]
MGSLQFTKATKQRRGKAGKVDASLSKKLQEAKWGEFKLGDLFDIKNTLSFNKEKLTVGNQYDYVTRTSQNQGILIETGYINKENLNSSGNWSLGLLQMDFFYRQKPWYAGQFVRKIVPKIQLKKNSVLYFTALLNKQKQNLLSVLVRDVDKTFLNTIVQLPILKDGQIDFDFMENFIAELEAERIAELEAERIAELEAYLSVTGLKDYTLTKEEQQALDYFESDQIKFGKYAYSTIFNKIIQGRRLKKDDQIPGKIPFVMAGITNTGVINYISNPVAIFPRNSITIDIFGNTFYRNYTFGAGDDTGVYWNDNVNYSKKIMLYLTASIRKSLVGKFSYGKKLRSSRSLNFKILLPIQSNIPNYQAMETFISAIQKLVIKDVVLYANQKIAATKMVVQSENNKN